MRYFLSVDYGGTNTKSIIISEQGEQVAVSSFETLSIEEKIGFREVNLEETWEAIENSIKNVIEKSGVAPQNIAAVTCIGHGKGLYLLDKNHKEFRNGILSTDSRANDIAQEFEKRVEEIWEKTHQHIVGVQNPVLLNWLKQNDPEAYQNIGCILSAKDYIRFKLTNTLNQEYTDASGNHWVNLTTGVYDREVLDFFDIAEMWEALPELVPSSHIVGGITSSVAKNTGLVKGTPVVAGLFDIDACAIASGVYDDSLFSVIAGTWNINTYPSKQFASLSSGQMNSFFPNQDVLVEGSSPTSAGNLAIMLKTLMSEEIKNLPENVSIYSVLEDFLEHTDAKFSKLIFYPFLYGNNIGQAADACFLGLSSTTTKSEMLRAVYEGIVFAHRQHIETLLATLGHRPKALRVSGGATNSPAWMQIFADIINLPVETVEGTELGGLGGAILCRQALDNKTLETCISEMVKVEQTFTPKKHEVLIYDKKYRAYQNSLLVLGDALSTIHQLKLELED